jgi:hypothetical protein
MAFGKRYWTLNPLAPYADHQVAPQQLGATRRIFCFVAQKSQYRIANNFDAAALLK